MLEVFERHKTISTYVNNFCQNTKRGIRKSILKLRDEVLAHVPEAILRNLKDHLYHEAFRFTSPEDIEIDDDIPNMRKLQITNENDPR